MDIYRHLSKHKYINTLIIFVFLSIISTAILFNTHIIFGGWDLGFHLRRIFELKESMEHGNLLPEFSFNQYHGSAVMALYPFINLIPLSLLSFIVKSEVALIYIWFIINELVMLLISFYSSYLYNKSYKISFVFSVLYGTSTVLLYTYFYNMDFGVLTSLTIFPLVISGTLNLIHKNKWIELSLGLSLLIFSHILSTLIAILFILICILFNYKLINKNKCKLFLKTGLLTGLCTSIIWVSFINFSLFNMSNIAKPASIASFGISFKKLLSDGLFNSVNPYDLSFIAIISVATSIIFYTKFNITLKKMFWVSVLIMFVCSNVFPWHLTTHGVFKLFGIVQFPGRLYVIPQILLTYIISVILVKYVHFHTNIIIVTVLVLSIILQLLGQANIINHNRTAPIINNNYINTYVLSGHKLPSYKHINSNYRVVNNNQLNNVTNFNLSPTFDYYPKNSISMIHYINNNKGIINNNRNSLFSVKHRGYNKFEFYINNYNGSISLPFVGYNHERLKLFLNNKPHKYYVNKHGMITLNKIRSGNNELNIEYKPNLMLFSIKIILFACGILWLIDIIINKRRVNI